MANWVKHAWLAAPFLIAACGGKVFREEDDERWPGAGSAQGGGGGDFVLGQGGGTSGVAGKSSFAGGAGGKAGTVTGSGGEVGDGGEVGNGGAGGDPGTLDPWTVRVTTPSPGGLDPTVDWGGGHPAVSGNGRYVVFKSFAPLVPEVDADVQVYRRDLWTNEIELVSVQYDGSPAQYPVWNDITGVSYDGRYVAFAAYRFPEDDPGSISPPYHVYLRDMDAGTTELVSVGNDDSPGNADSFAPTLSFDGRFVAFSSRANNLAPVDSDTVTDIFVRDVVTGTTQCVSVAFDGGEPDDYSDNAFISGDGRYVAFYSRATNLLSEPAVAIGDVYVKDLLTNTLEPASMGSDGCGADEACSGPSLSEDGRYVTFYYESWAADGVRYFRRDRQTGQVLPVSGSFDGQPVTECIDLPVTMSADGRYVAFTSCSDNVATGDTNGEMDVVVRDFEAGTAFRASLNDSGVEADGASNSSWISADGAVVVFVSDATNLVPGDVNGGYDVFARYWQSSE